MAVTVTDKNGNAVGSGTTVSMAVNGGAVVTSTTNADGIATFNDGIDSHTVAGVSSGTVLSMWLPKGNGTGATVDVTNGTTLGFTLQQSTLTVRNDVGSAVTNSQLAVASASGSNADLNAVYTMSGTTLVAADNTTLKIPTGVTFTPGGKVNADDFRVAGTFHMGTNDVTVRGSWDATGGKFDGTNTVSFTSTADETITVSKNSFANVVFVTGNNPQGQVGTWTTTDKLSVTGNQTIQNGALDPHVPPVLSAATVSPVYDRLAVVNWTTDTASTSKVLYGTDSGALTMVVFPGSGQTLDTGHAVTLTGLSPAETYYGRAVSADYWGNTGTGSIFSFTTMAKLSTQEEVAAAAALAQAAGYEQGVSQLPQARGGGGGGGRTRSTCPTPLTISGLAATASGNTENVTWTTNGVAISHVKLGIQSTDERRDWSEDFVTDHALTLTSLRPSSTYKLVASAVDQCGNVATSSEFTFQSGSGTLTDQQLQDLSLHAAAGQADIGTVQRALALLQSITQSMPLSQLQPTLLAESNTLADIARGLPGPVLSGEPKVDVKDTTATVSWSTDQASNSLVSFNDASTYSSGTYAMTAGNPDDQTQQHTVTIVGLQPGGTYHFQVKSQTPLGTQSESPDYTFQTPDLHPSIDNYKAKVLSTTSALFQWQTNVETASQVTAIPYQNGVLQPSEADTVSDGALTTMHGITLDTLEPGTSYAVELSGKTVAGTDVTQTIPSFATTMTSAAPVISQVKTDVTLSPGQQSTIQMIVTWDTDRRATSKVLYEKGVATDPNATLTDASPLATSFDKSHTVVLVGLDPGTVYSFQVASTDFDGHTATSRIFTILTPSQQQGIFQVIMQEFSDTFSWMNFASGQ